MSDKASNDKLDLKVPNTGRHFIVEFPGYVQNEQAVLETIGGLDGIARQLQDNAADLPLKLRPGDPHCHPIHGQRQRSVSLLLKLTRPINSPPNPTAVPTSKKQQGSKSSKSNAAASPSSPPPSSSYTAEIVATADAVYRFSNPADYQYVGRDLRPTEVINQQQHDGPKFLPQQPLLCSPPLFAKQPEFDYAFGSHEPSGGTSGRLKKFSISIGFFSAPSEVPAALTTPPETRDALKPLQQHVIGLLESRPVWTGAAIHEAAPEGTTRQAIDELMPKLCYRFKNGPWKHAWVRRGYDPRTDTTSRQYQVLEYQLPSEWYDRISKKKAEQKNAAAADTVAGPSSSSAFIMPPLATSFSQLATFTAVPSTHHTYLQLLDINDDEVQEIVSASDNHSSECSDASGWLSAAAWEKVKRRVRTRFLAVLEEGTQRAAVENMQQQQAMDIDAVDTETLREKQQTNGESARQVLATGGGVEQSAVPVGGDSLDQMLALLSVEGGDQGGLALLEETGQPHNIHRMNDIGGTGGGNIGNNRQQQRRQSEEDSGNGMDSQVLGVGEGTGYSTDEGGYGQTDEEDGFTSGEDI